MAEKINILILTCQQFLSEAKDYLSNDPDVRVVLATTNPGDIMTRLANDGKKSTGAVLADNSGIPVTNQELLSEIKTYGIPIITIAPNVSEGFVLLSKGADDMIVRRAVPDENGAFFYRMVAVHIVETVKKFSENKNRVTKITSNKPIDKVIAIGSSTGGTETILDILKKMPADAPPIVVVQHMPPVFTKLYAERANMLCKMSVWEARDGDALARGLVLLAPGGSHMVLQKKGGRYTVSLTGDPPVFSQRPAVDVLFNSVAEYARADAVGVILTGMGEDGAAGLLAMRKNGAYTIGQDKDTSIVYGMPKAAFERGAVTVQMPLDKIAQEILDKAYK